ncbi:MAG: dTDP-4-dehydrorhamnose reductase [Thermoanaerobacterium sp.]|nr:dTDP-4-dehydrorhamnose reductase [Thermoanaerobacterium sp.]
MKVLITGAKGQLGQAFQKKFEQLNIEYLAKGSKELDITKMDQLRDLIQSENGITHIINCAAYNYVDKAEEEWEKAYQINGLGVRNLSIISNEINAELIHYSTDYVFSGKKGEYTIYDTPDPINKYGESKALGEREATQAQRYYLIRTSWVFGVGKDNFAKKVITWSQNSKELKITTDEKSAPTYTLDLVEATLDLIKQKAYGLYHITNTPCTRYEWAEYILKKIGWQGTLMQAKRSDFNLPAQRPESSVLNNFGYTEVTGKKMPDWKDATDRFLKEMGLIE